MFKVNPGSLKVLHTTAHLAWLVIELVKATSPAPMLQESCYLIDKRSPLTAGGGSTTITVRAQNTMLLPQHTPRRIKTHTHDELCKLFGISAQSLTVVLDSCPAPKKIIAEAISQAVLFLRHRPADSAYIKYSNCAVLCDEIYQRITPKPPPGFYAVELREK